MKNKKLSFVLAAASFLSLVAVVACGGPKQYDVHFTGDKSSPAIKVTIAAPSGLKEEVNDSGAPTFKPSGNHFTPNLSVVALSLGQDAAANMEKAISLQYSTDPVARTDKGEGRIWMSRANDAGYIDARLFVPVPQGVLMCVSMLGPDEASRLPEFQKACEEMKVAP